MTRFTILVLSCVLNFGTIAPEPAYTQYVPPSRFVYQRLAVVSRYSNYFHGRRTASGTRFDQRAFTAAHRHLPFGTSVKFVNPATGASVVCTITDNGPFVKGREFDISRAAAQKLGIMKAGVAAVEYFVEVKTDAVDS